MRLASVVGAILAALAILGARVLATDVGLAADRTPPLDPVTVSSPSHAVGVASGDPTIDVRWSAARDPSRRDERRSGVAGYSVVWDQDPRTQRDGTIEERDTSATSAVLPSGSWYFHLSTLDRAGNRTGTRHLGPLVILVSPDAAASNTTSTTTGRRKASPGPQSPTTKPSAPTATPPPAPTMPPPSPPPTDPPNPPH